MKKLILILIVFSGQSFAQNQSILPYGEFLVSPSPNIKGGYTFFADGRAMKKIKKYLVLLTLLTAASSVATSARAEGFLFFKTERTK